jgi:hypothetical protein
MTKHAAFMTTRTGDDYPPALHHVFTTDADQEGDGVSASPFPVLDVMQAWDVWSMLTRTDPGPGPPPHRASRAQPSTRADHAALRRHARPPVRRRIPSRRR